MDLVEVDPNSDPPVCRIMDYGKWLYQQKRKIRESHKKTVVHSNVLKEIRLRPETDKHDIEIKVNHAREFLEKGHKVQFTLIFKGRQMLHQEKGIEIFTFISQSLELISKAEPFGRMTNRRMILLLAPNK